MMFRIVLALAWLTPSLASAQYSIGTIYQPLSIVTPPGGNTCSRTWYDPDIHLLPNGTDLGLLAQTSTPSYCTDVAVDTIFSGSRNGGNGQWTLPGRVDGYANGCPTIQGQYTRCGFESWFHSGPIASPSVVRLANPNSPTGVRYYMAFVGGNADFLQGKMYWAVSDDGQNWEVYRRGETEYWTPIIAAKYTRSANAPRSATACEPPSGLGQVQLAFEDDRFYVFFQYYHPVQPACAEGHETAACIASGQQVYDRALSSGVYRFDYNPRHPFGFGGSVREMYVQGRWQPHSTKLVWGYDVDAEGKQLPPDPNNPVLELFDSVQTAGFAFGPGDVKFGNGQWLHAYVFAHVMYAQRATSLDPDRAQWSLPEVVNVSRVREAYPLSTSDPAPGIWYGSLSDTREQWWIWAPVPSEDRLCAGTTIPVNPFGGLALLPAVLCTPDRPCDG